MSKMTERRKQRNEYRSWKKGYYHLSTDGWKEGCLFHTPAQYAYGMILIGLLVLKYSLKIYSFSLMPNHIHLVLCATGNACVEAFDYFRKKINERLVKDGYPPLPPDYGFNLAPITTEKQMRNWKNKFVFRAVIRGAPVICNLVRWRAFLEAYGLAACPNGI